MVATGRATSLSPLDLQDRVLAKGKVRNAATCKNSNRSTMWKALKARPNTIRTDAHEKGSSKEAPAQRFTLQSRRSTEEMLTEVKRGNLQAPPKLCASDSVVGEIADGADRPTQESSFGAASVHEMKTRASKRATQSNPCQSQSPIAGL
jgi:hypothetical protein|eukprot:3094196-Prymnesium_polylepis.1